MLSLLLRATRLRLGVLSPAARAQRRPGPGDRAGLRLQVADVTLTPSPSPSQAGTYTSKVKPLPVPLPVTLPACGKWRRSLSEAERSDGDSHSLHSNHRAALETCDIDLDEDLPVKDLLLLLVIMMMLSGAVDVDDGVLYDQPELSTTDDAMSPAVNPFVAKGVASSGSTSREVELAHPP